MYLNTPSSSIYTRRKIKNHPEQKDLFNVLVLIKKIKVFSTLNTFTFINININYISNKIKSVKEILTINIY